MRSVKRGAFSRKVAAAYQPISAEHHQRQPVNEMSEQLHIFICLYQANLPPDSELAGASAISACHLATAALIRYSL